MDVRAYGCNKAACLQDSVGPTLRGLPPRSPHEAFAIFHSHYTSFLMAKNGRVWLLFLALNDSRFVWNVFSVNSTQVVHRLSRVFLGHTICSF